MGHRRGKMVQNKLNRKKVRNQGKGVDNDKVDGRIGGELRIFDTKNSIFSGFSETSERVFTQKGMEKYK